MSANNPTSSSTQSSPLIYAGIGSRETPKAILDVMVLLGTELARMGWVLRSGGASGADRAFEIGADRLSGAKEIYLPWKGFNGNPSPLFSPSAEAFDMAAKFHPNWPACSAAAMSFHARNCHQVLGLGLNQPVDMVLCYTKGGRMQGGTGQALRLANALNIRIFDLGLFEDDPNEYLTQLHDYVTALATRRAAG